MHESSGTNYHCYFCRRPVLPIEHEFQLDDDKVEESGDIEGHCKNVKKFKKSMFAEVNANIKSAQKRYKKDYDKRRCSKKVCRMNLAALNDAFSSGI